MKCTIQNRRLYFISYTPEELVWVTKKLTWEKTYGKTTTIDTLMLYEGRVPYTFYGIYHLLVEQGLTIELTNPEALNRTFEKHDVDPDLLSGITILPFQVAAVKKILGLKTGLCIMPTSAGKTEVLSAVIKMLLTKGINSFLIVVPTVGLLENIKSRLIKRGFASTQIGSIGGGEKSFSEINIAVSDSIYEGIKNNDPEIMSIIQTTKALFYDEVHHLRSESWKSIALNCLSSEYLIGLSGTPFVGDKVLDSFGDTLVYGVTGGPIFKVSHKHLRNVELPDGTVGLIAEPVVCFLPVSGQMSKVRWRYNKVYDMYVVQNESRNKKIIEALNFFYKFGFPTLTLVQRREHAEILLRMFDKPDCCAVFGGNKSLIPDGDGDYVENYIDYTRFISDFERGTWKAAFATQVFDEGIDMPAIAAVNMAGAGRSKIKVPQRFGRGLRKKSVGPNRVYIIDFKDRSHVYLSAQSKARRKLYESMDATIVEDPNEFYMMVMKHYEELNG